MGYPSRGAEVAMLDSHGAHNPLETLQPVTDATTVLAAIEAIRHIYASPAVRQYVVDIAAATRSTAALRLGASPRAALHLLRAARAYSALEDRDYVLPDDVKTVAGDVLAHRLLPSSETQLARRSTRDVVAELLVRVPVPAGVDARS